MGNMRSLYIPKVPQHEGYHGITINLMWVCPVCGAERGDIKKARSYDGSRILECDGWENKCGHIDKYSDCIKEAKKNGLN